MTTVGRLSVDPRETHDIATVATIVNVATMRAQDTQDAQVRMAAHLIE